MKTTMRVAGIVGAVFALSLGWSASADAQDKTVVYRGTMYNLKNITKIASRIEVVDAEGNTTVMPRLEKKEFEAYVKEHGAPLLRTVIVMDEEEMVYLQVRPKKYSDYKKMLKRFDGAMAEIQKFMGTKKRQLQLK